MEIPLSVAFMIRLGKKTKILAIRLGAFRLRRINSEQDDADNVLKTMPI